MVDVKNSNKPNNGILFKGTKVGTSKSGSNHIGLIIAVDQLNKIIEAAEQSKSGYVALDLYISERTNNNGSKFLSTVGFAKALQGKAEVRPKLNPTSGTSAEVLRTGSEGPRSTSAGLVASNTVTDNVNEAIKRLKARANNAS